MRVRLDTYERVHRNVRGRSLLFLIFGALGVVVSSFIGLMGLLMFVMDNGGLWERRTGVVLGIFGGFFPLAASAIMLWRGWVGRARVGRLRDLAALARTRPGFTSRDVVETLHLRPMDAERLLLEATELGLMEEGGPEEQAAPQISAAPQVSAVPQVSGVRPVEARALPAGSAASTPGAWIGAVINGTYQIERQLGAGGMGMVHAARHLRTGRRYAIKTLLPDARLSPDAIKRFEREATAASAIGHPGIVAVHDFHETEDGVHYLVMDLLEGETLEERLARAGSLPWAEARRIAAEIGEALAAAHDRGLLHRDLKPANVFLARAPGAPERAVLLDFGLAKQLGDEAVSRLTQSGAAVGTPLYMSPEQARGEALDVRSDVYALGAVLFEMVTGTPPFFDRTVAGVYARLLTEPSPRASGVAPCPPALDDVLEHALAKAPADRFGSVRAFLAALAHVGAREARSA
jgi:tRNA A-37 threonylcarbamoyl transferase component Bud32